jgi:chromate transporter
VWSSWNILYKRRDKEMVYLKLLYVFLKVGFFSFGGGLAMLPMVKSETFKYGWLTESEFLDIISISQITPGAIAINTATFVGYKIGGILGAFTASMGIVLPSLITVTIIAMFFNKIKENPYKNAFFRGVKPVTIALILYAGVIVGVPTFIGAVSNRNINFGAIAIFLLTVLLQLKFKINLIYILMLAGALGLIIA